FARAMDLVQKRLCLFENLTTQVVLRSCDRLFELRDALFDRGGRLALVATQRPERLPDLHRFAVESGGQRLGLLLEVRLDDLRAPTSLLLELREPRREVRLGACEPTLQ